jgi:hypothetical protein
MEKLELTVLELVNHLIQKHPQLAQSIESMASLAQGKGYNHTNMQE